MSDENAEDAGYDIEGIVSFYTCGSCGAEYEVLTAINKEE